MTAAYPIPRFRRAAVLVAEASAVLAPPNDVAPSEWAETERQLANRGGGWQGGWTWDLTPYLKAPTDDLAGGAYRTVALLGPAQCGKTEILLTWIGHTVAEDPADMLVLQPDKALAREFMISRVGELIRLTPSVAARLRSADDDLVFEKRFAGCTVYGVWPVGSQLRQRPVPRVAADDFDQLPEDIDGQGDPATLLGGRQTSFEGRDVGLYLSSPALGPKRGIEAIVAAGTDCRWHWPCPECATWFTPSFDQLHVRSADGLTPVGQWGGSSAAAGDGAVLVCPACGSEIEHRHKRGMNLAGRWVAAGQTIDAEGRVSGEPRRSATASYRVHGLMGFSSWGRLAELYVEAEGQFRSLQDERKLRAFWNVRLGQNYESRLGVTEELTADRLDARKGGHLLGQVPAGVKVLTAAVDVQGAAFEVAVWGWGDGLESWLVDRFRIVETADGAPVRPARYPEHWLELLRQVVWRRVPLAGRPDLTMPVLTTASDSQGEPGVANNAVQFWHSARAAGVSAKGLTLLKGASHRQSRLVSAPTVLEGEGKRRQGLKPAELHLANTDALKDILHARLNRDEPGPGYVHLPADLGDEHRDELLGERRINGRWERVAARNETWDLAVYGYAALIRLAGERADLGWVPAWAQRPAVPDEAPAPVVEAVRRHAGQVLPAAPPPTGPRRQRRLLHGGIGGH